MASRRSVRSPERSARELARELATASQADALALDKAVIVGNRAGVVEWTNEAWSRLTGFPLAETLDKPISHFLHHAGLEIELVEFVAQHFLEGRSCTVESAFDTFDGRQIQVHLHVEPKRDAAGEIDRFVAVASEIPAREGLDGDDTSRPTSRPTSHSTPHSTPHSTSRSPKADLLLSRSRRQHKETIATSDLCTDVRHDCVVLEPAVLDVLRRLTPADRGDAFFELIGDPEPARVEVDPCLLDELIRVLACTAFSSTNGRSGYVSVLTGRLAGHRLHRSRVHPISIVLDVTDPLQCSYLEIHDTGPHLDRDALDRIERLCPTSDLRERALVDAHRLSERMGAALHLNSTPGCGTQILIAFRNALSQDPHAQAPHT